MVCQLLSRYLGNCFYSVDSLCCFAMKGNKYIYYSPYRRKDGGYYFRTAFASRHSKTNGIENIIKCSMFLSLVFLEHTSSLLYHFLFHSKQSPLLLTLVSNLIPNYFEGNPEKEVAFCVRKVFFIRSLKIIQLILIMHAYESTLSISII